MSAGESAIAIIVVFTASLRGDLPADHCGRGAGEGGRERGKIRASDKHRAKRSSASCAAKKESTSLGGGGARKRGPFQARRRCSSEDLGRTERTKGVAVVGSITVD